MICYEIIELVKKEVPNLEVNIKVSKNIGNIIKSQVHIGISFPLGASLLE